MFKKLKDKKGFTLVELIVVLVILAILAALLVPALTGYIDKANNEKIIATTRQIVMAAQTEVSEAYGKTAGVKAPTDGKLDNTANSNPTLKTITTLAEVYDKDVNGAASYKNGITKVEVTVDTTNGHVSQVYVEQSGKKCTYYEDATNATAGAGETAEGNYVVGKAPTA